MEQPSHHRDFEIPLEGKNPIKCISSSPPLSSTSATTVTSPSVIFTHGAGGTLHSDAVLNFRTGFASHSPMTCFQGSMNLPSRVKMFDAVIAHQAESAPVTALGGRSMGARAAAMAAKGKEEVKYLVLVSYPLHTSSGDMRHEILLAIEEGIKVLFVVGDGDTMCDLERLEDVRQKMSAVSWRIVVESADHGMTIRPKTGTKGVGELTGKVVAEWLKGLEESRLEGQGKESRISWDSEENMGKWSGWEEEASNMAVKSKKGQKKSTVSKTEQPEEGKYREGNTEKKGGKRSRSALSSDTQKEKVTHKRRKA